VARRAWAATAAAGIVSGLLCWAAYRLPPETTSDFAQIWIGARALFSGADPYTVVPTTGTRYPLFYPATSLVAAAPFAAVPLELARVLWAAVNGGALAFAAVRYGRGLPPALLGACFLNAVVQGQWSPLLTAAAVLPTLSWLWAAKPSVGAALFAAYPGRTAMAGGALLAAVSLALFPGWPLRWVESLGETNHVAPVLRPGGVLLLLALLRWRRAEGRLLAALSCAPQTIGLYEALPLFLIPRTRWQGYGLAVASYAVAFGQALLVPRGPEMSWETVNEARWPFIFIFLYLPALVMVLRHGRSEPAGRADQGMR
jgi:hypothetical protein